MKDSSISKFFEKSRKERLDIVKNFSNLSDEEINLLENSNGGISFENADKMVENAIGTFSLPLGIATNFKINGKDYVIPMVIEEPSVIAAASKGAKIARFLGGFEVNSEESYSVGQIQMLDVDIPKAIEDIKTHMPVIRSSLLMLFGSQDFEVIATREGKEKLLIDATEDINTSLQKLAAKTELETVVEAAYFNSFVIQ